MININKEKRAAQAQWLCKSWAVPYFI